MAMDQMYTDTLRELERIKKDLDRLEATLASVTAERDEYRRLSDSYNDLWHKTKDRNDALNTLLRESEEELAHTQAQRDAAILRAQRAEDGEQALAAHVEAQATELSACQSVLYQLARDGEVTPQYADDAKRVLAQKPPTSLAQRDTEKVRQGRAEALAIIMELDAEEGLDDYITSRPIGDTGDYGFEWEKDKLAALLHTDDSVWSLQSQADGEYWHNLGLREHFEQFRERLIAEKQDEAVSAACAAAMPGPCNPPDDPPAGFQEFCEGVAEVLEAHRRLRRQAEGERHD
ncbi:MAG: hypothetical protein CME72_11710 [Halomonadaceae bacterium]|nr:hypothetical protein [Halomonadaceae bacterium]